MTSFDPLPAARALWQARQDRVPLTPLPPAIVPATKLQGAAVQAALAHLAGATPPCGFKIGATGARMQAYLGVDAPIAGFMRTLDVYHDNAELRFADFLNPGAECELAVRLAHDLPPGPCSLQQAQEAVGDVFAAIEIVENRYGDLRLLGTPTLLADQMYHAAAILGDQPGTDWRSVELGTLSGRISLDNGITDHGLAADLLGHPLNCLAWLAGSVEAAAFGGLKAGQVVMLGSVTPPVWLDGPATVTVAFPPLPAATVRLV